MKDKKMLTEIIENISASDTYADLNEEVERKCVGFKVEQFRGGELVKEQKKYEPIVPLYKSQIKDRFPFLSFYNDYKDGLPKDFLINFLFDVVTRYRYNLKSKRIYDLKYELTEEYLKHIRNSLYNPLYPKISYLALEKVRYKALNSLQVEIKTYIDKVKDKTREIEIKNEQFIDNQVEKLEFERKFNTMTNSNANVISLKEILSDNGNGGVIIYPFQINIIERFCKYGRENEDSYSFINYYVLVKNSLLKEIAHSSNQNNYDFALQSELHKNGIPLDCKKDIKIWIDDHSDHLTI